MNSSVTRLSSLGILEISGEEASSFLQAQLTSNIILLGEGQSAWSAWCHANGRVITTFLVAMTAGHYYLILPTDMIDAVCKRLKMFVLRAKVKIDDITAQYGCLGASIVRNESGADELFNWDFSIARAAIPNDAVRTIWITARNEMPALFAGLAANGIRITDEQHWQIQDIVAGIPWIHSQTSEEALPQELDLERLGGLSYDKGCYPGQEVIARLHYRGKQKRQICKGVTDSSDSLPVIGSKLSGQSDGQSAGLVLALTRDSDNRIHLLMLVDTELAATNTVTLENGIHVHYTPIVATV